MLSSEIDYSKYDDDLSALQLDNYIVYYLELNGIDTIGKLLQTLNEKKFRIPHIGPIRIAEITAAFLGYLTNKMENCIC